MTGGERGREDEEEEAMGLERGGRAVVEEEAEADELDEEALLVVMELEEE